MESYISHLNIKTKSYLLSEEKNNVEKIVLKILKVKLKALWKWIEQFKS